MSIIAKLSDEITAIQKRVDAQTAIAKRESYKRVQVLETILFLFEKLEKLLFQFLEQDISQTERFATANYLFSVENFRNIIEFRLFEIENITAKGGQS